MDRSIVPSPKSGVSHYVAAAVATVAIAAVVAAAMACMRQAVGLPLLTEDVTWMLFDVA